MNNLSDKDLGLWLFNLGLSKNSKKRGILQSDENNNKLIYYWWDDLSKELLHAEDYNKHSNVYSNHVLIIRKNCLSHIKFVLSTYKIIQ